MRREHRGCGPTLNAAEVLGHCTDGVGVNHNRKWAALHERPNFVIDLGTPANAGPDYCSAESTDVGECLANPVFTAPSLNC